MKRVIKLEGKGNIAVEEIDIPNITSNEVLVKNEKSLISRGSELFARYVMPNAVSPSIMGYSDAGIITAIGNDINDIKVGDRVTAVAPHAEYVACITSNAMIIPLPDDVSYEEAVFLPLLTSSVAWAQSANIKEGDTVAILGQGLVGNLVMQVSKGYKPAKIIVIDALDLRCKLAEQLGADVVINCSKSDPVESVRSLTSGKGADVVIDCVGGDAGIKSFEQAQDMVKAQGTIHIIALYQGNPLPLYSSKIMNKRLLAGILISEPREQTAQRAIKLIQDGSVRVKEMITHRFPITEAKQAFDLLYEHPDKAMGVIFEY
jgi:2-desacetyl-2-hydroxyethyl bacteriochlorophyllide A dehydrogenase